MSEAITNGHIRYFFKGTAAVSAGRAVGEGLNYLGFVAVARWFGIETAGIFFLALSILNVLSVATRLGLDNSLIKYSAEYLYKKTYKRISALLSIAIICISAFSVFLLGGWVGAQNWLVPLFSTPHTYWMVTIMLMALPCYSIATVLVSATRGAKNINYHVALTFVLFPAAFLILLLATRSTPWRDCAPFVSYAVGTLLFCGAAVWAVRRMYRFRLMLRVFGTRLFRDLFVYSIPLWISSLVCILYLRTDLFFVSQFFDDRALGIYSSGIKTAAGISILLATSNLVIGPLFSELHVRRAFGEMGVIFQIMCKWISVMGLLAMGGYLLFLNQFLQLFQIRGNEFQLIFLLLGFGQLFNAVTGPVGTLLTMTGNQKFMMVNDIVFYIMDLMLLTACIVWFGLPGAALATAVTILMTNVSRAVQVYRKYTIHMFNRQSAALLGFGAVSLALLAWLRLGPLDPVMNWWVSGIGFLVYAAVMALFVWAFCLQREDRELIERLRRRLGAA